MNARALLEGVVPKRWRLVTLNDVKAPGEYTFVGGPFGSSLTTKDYVSMPGVPVIRGTNLGGSTGTFVDDDFVFVSQEKAEELTRNLAYPGDLIFTQRGTVGQVGIIPLTSRYGCYVVSQSQMKLTVDEQLADPRYLYHYYRSPLAGVQLRGRLLTTGVPHINLGILKEFPIPLPPRDEQRRIADILDKADAIRRKRKEAIALTEELLRSVFLDMFGDPVTNPKGWPVTTLKAELGEGLRYGTSQKCSSEPSAGALPVLRIPNVLHERISWDDLKYAALDPAEAARIRLREGDILFVRSNGNPDYIARCAVVEEARDAAYASYLIRARLRHDACVLPVVVRDIISFPSHRARIVQEARTTAGNYNINTQALGRIRLFAPPPELQRRYFSTAVAVRALHDKQVQALAESENLFHSLEQRAFRGEL